MVCLWNLNETYHSVQDTLCSRLPGIQWHSGLLQQLLVHHLDPGLGLDAFLQTVETFVRHQLERVDLSCGHVQDVDDLERQEKKLLVQKAQTNRNVVLVPEQKLVSSGRWYKKNHHIVVISLKHTNQVSVPELWCWIMSKTVSAEYYDITLKLSFELSDIKCLHSPKTSVWELMSHLYKLLSNG